MCHFLQLHLHLLTKKLPLLLHSPCLPLYPMYCFGQVRWGFCLSCTLYEAKCHTLLAPVFRSCCPIHHAVCLFVYTFLWLTHIIVISVLYCKRSGDKPRRPRGHGACYVLCCTQTAWLPPDGVRRIQMYSWSHAISDLICSLGLLKSRVLTNAKKHYRISKNEASVRPTPGLSIRKVQNFNEW